MDTAQFSQSRGGAAGVDEMIPGLEQLHASIVERLDRAGVELPHAVIANIADDVLADAVRIALRWLENG
jgi:hypothetical protein